MSASLCSPRKSYNRKRVNACVELFSQYLVKIVNGCYCYLQFQYAIHIRQKIFRQKMKSTLICFLILRSLNEKKERKTHH